MYSLILSPKNNLKVQILTNVRAGLEMSGPGRAFDKCQGRAGRPGSLRVAGRGSLVADFTRVAGRGARFGDPPRPCQPGSFVSSTRGCGSCDRAFRQSPFGSRRANGEDEVPRIVAVWQAHRRFDLPTGACRASKPKVQDL